MSLAPRTGRRSAAALAPVGAVLVAAALLLLLPLAGPALAHGTVTARPAQAGAQDARLSFHVSSESEHAGAASVAVRLPRGIPAEDVTWVEGPPGWTMQATPEGFTAAGPPLVPGMPARWAVTVRRLPDVASLAFPTVVRYADGSSDAWDQPPVPGKAQPAHPAPVLALTGAGGGPDVRAVAVWGAAAVVLLAGVALIRSASGRSRDGTGSA